MSKNYLLYFSIGPVQSFIAQARKTIDLFGGSNFLSQLIGAALNEVKNIEDIIFPGRGEENGFRSMPNKFLIKVNIEGEVKDYAGRIEKKIREAISSRSETALKNAGIEKPDTFDEQIDAFCNVLWTGVPLTDDYENSYKKVTELMGAVKNTGVFKPFEEAGNRKCSLCGERNALFYNSDNPDCPEKKRPLFLYEGAKKVNRLDFNEMICGICLTKRYFLNTGFSSTAGFSSMEWASRIREKDKDTYESLFKGKEGVPFEKQLYYEENLSYEYLEKYGHKSGEPEKAKKLLSKLYEKYGKPSKYYALLMFDGDNMGKWFKGKYLHVKNDIELHRFQKRLSGKLMEFGKAVSDFLVPPYGRSVYNGGDDFMGFVNISRLFSIFYKFDKMFNDIVNEGISPFTKEKMTFSAGVVIAHYKTPLSEVLKETRKMEKAAKEYDDDKNGIGMAFITKSNNVYETVFRYNQHKLLEKLFCSLKNDDIKLSSKFIFSFARLFNTFEERYSIDEYKIVTAMTMTELKRLMKRATDKYDDIKCLYMLLVDYFFSIIKDAGRGYYNIPIGKFISFLEMGGKLAREVPGVYKNKTP